MAGSTGQRGAATGQRRQLFPAFSWRLMGIEHRFRGSLPRSRWRHQR